MKKAAIALLLGVTMVSLAPPAQASWVDTALQRISRININWKKVVVRSGLSMAITGIHGAIITQYYRNNGLYCPDKPWWVPVPLNVWAVLTCAEHAQ